MRMQYTRDDGQHLVKGESLQKSYVELIPLKTFSTIERIPSSSSCFSTILSSTLFIYAFALISFYTFENLIFNRYIYTHKRDDDIRHEIAYMTLSRVYRIKHGIENGIERYIKDRAKFGRLPFVSFRWEKVIARGSSKVAENGVNAKPLGRGGLYSRGGTKPQWLAEGGGRESLPRFGVLPRFVSKRETATWSFPIKRGLYRFVSVLKIHRYPRFDHRYIPARRVNPRQPGLAHNRPGTSWIFHSRPSNHRNFGQQRLGDISMYHEADEKRDYPWPFPPFFFLPPRFPFGDCLNRLPAAAAAAAAA